MASPEQLGGHPEVGPEHGRALELAGSQEAPDQELVEGAAEVPEAIVALPVGEGLVAVGPPVEKQPAVEGSPLLHPD